MTTTTMLPTSFLTLAQRTAGLLAATALVALTAGCSNYPRLETDLGLPELQQASTPKTQPPASAAQLPRLKADTPRQPYRLGPQDELAVTVWGPSDLWSAVSSQNGQTTTQSSTVVVQDDGTIALPLIKPVDVGNLSVNEAVHKLAEAYRAVAGARFQIDAKVTRFHSKSVLLDGAVNKPGLVYLSPEAVTLGDAISGAGGGLPDSADIARGTLTRDGKSYAVNYQPANGNDDLHDIVLQPGDRIFFPSRVNGVFYVFGEVGSQGVYNIPPAGLTLLQALAQARGPQVVSANMDSIYLVRPGDPEARIYKLKMGEILASKDLMITPNDRLLVPSTGLANWDRTVRQLLPVLAGGVVVNNVANP
jgi:polysaccharide export outer membrane protein